MFIAGEKFAITLELEDSECMHSFSSTPPVGVHSKDCYGRSFSPPIKVIFESRDDQQHCNRKKNALSSTKLY